MQTKNDYCLVNNSTLKRKNKKNSRKNAFFSTCEDLKTKKPHQSIQKESCSEYFLKWNLSFLKHYFNPILLLKKHITTRTPHCVAEPNLRSTANTITGNEFR